MSPPRLHVLPAADSAVVIRRGPSRWWHILRWRLDAPGVEPGAWFCGKLYPRRSAVSADGKLLGYYALAGKPPPWDSYSGARGTCRASSAGPRCSSSSARTSGSRPARRSCCAGPSRAGVAPPCSSCTAGMTSPGTGVEGADISYALERDGDRSALPDVAWADWDRRGRMLIATVAGELRIAEVTPAGVETVWSHDLSHLEPSPARAPEWARRW
jgi:hypothetical protein